MTRIAYCKNNLSKFITLNDGTSIEWELENNIIPNFAGSIEDYGFTETNELYFHLEEIDGEVVVIKDEPPTLPRPLSPEDRIESLEQEKMILQLALAETIEMREVDKVNSQIALAELIETLIIKGVL